MYQVGKTLGYLHRMTPKTSSEKSPARGPSIRGGSSIQHGSLKQPLGEKMCFFFKDLLLCPIEEESSMLISSLPVNVCMCGWVGEKGDILARQMG
jgi:hypothetical protein